MTIASIHSTSENLLVKNLAATLGCSGVYIGLERDNKQAQNTFNDEWADGTNVI